MDDLLGANPTSNSPTNVVDPMSFMGPASPQETMSPAKEDPFSAMGAMPTPAMPTPAMPPKTSTGATGVANNEPDNSAVRAWEKENQAKIDAAALKETVSKQQKRQTAQQDLKQFYENRKDAMAKRKAQNRADEKEFMAKMGKEGNTGSLWEKVINLTTDPRADQTGPTHDTSRFKSLLYSLKEEPVPN